MKKAIRPAIFKWRQTAPELIVCAVRWYLRYSLSLRDVEELLDERGLKADHTTVWRWVQRYGPELEQRLRRHLTSQPTNPGVLMKPMFGSRAAGATCIAPLIPPVPPATSCCQRYAMPRRPNGCLARLSAIHRMRIPASSTPIRHASTAQRFQQ